MKAWIVKVVVDDDYPLTDDTEPLSILCDYMPCGCRGNADGECNFIAASSHGISLRNETDYVDWTYEIIDLDNEDTLPLDQQLKLLRHQQNPTSHPFTCGKDHAEHIRLVPGATGWWCPAQHCDYEQPYTEFEWRF